MQPRARQITDVVELVESMVRLAERVDRTLLDAQWAMLRSAIGEGPRLPVGDGQLDELREALEQRAHHVLAHHPQLAGSQLRMASAALTLAAELARIGECAHTIAALAAQGRHTASDEPPVILRQLAYKVREMLQQAVRAVVVQDATAIYRVREAARNVDTLYEQIQAGLLVQHDLSGQTEQATTTAWMAHYLERIAQRSVTIAERATFIVTGILPPRVQRIAVSVGDVRDAIGEMAAL